MTPREQQSIPKPIEPIIDLVVAIVASRWTYLIGAIVVGTWVYVQLAK